MTAGEPRHSGHGGGRHDWRSIYTPVPLWECGKCGARHENCNHYELPKLGCEGTPR